MNEGREHGHSEKPNFMATIDEIRKAEQDAEKSIGEAKRKADEILMKNKENLMKYNSETEAEVTKLKNSIFQKESAKIEGEVEDILSDAKKNAEGVKKRGLEQKEALSIIKSSFFEE